MYKEHIDTHVESAEAILVSDMPYRRLAAGFGLGMFNLETAMNLPINNIFVGFCSLVFAAI